MRIGNCKVQTFKIKNRRGFAAVCNNHLTEGRTTQEACSRMLKAMRRTSTRGSFKS
jgi:hypothetical protein